MTDNRMGDACDGLNVNFRLTAISSFANSLVMSKHVTDRQSA